VTVGREVSMAEVVVRDAAPEDVYFVSTCSHVDESAEIDACGSRRAEWLERMRADGLRAKVAAIGGEPIGFAYTMPIEVCPWGPLGRDLTVLPCLWVLPDHTKQGAGTALVGAAQEEARARGTKGLVTTAYEQYDWLMPVSFFASRGFSEVRRKGGTAIMWRVFDDTAEPPEFLEPRYEFRPVPGKVVVDLFWQTFCQTSDIEAARVREVAAEFGDRVVLHEHCADDHEVLLHHQIPRAIYVDGTEIGWGYEAPREGIREAIQKALGAVRDEG
jgi:GNAT superfamily N-acetyltransferase